MIDEIIYKSAGHVPRLPSEPWNRSSAWSGEFIARLNTATTAAIQSALKSFDELTAAANLTHAEKTEAYQFLMNDVLTEMQKFEESLRPRRAQIESFLKQ